MVQHSYPCSAGMPWQRVYDTLKLAATAIPPFVPFTTTPGPIIRFLSTFVFMDVPAPLYFITASGDSLSITRNKPAWQFRIILSFISFSVFVMAVSVLVLSICFYSSDSPDHVAGVISGFISYLAFYELFLSGRFADFLIFRPRLKTIVLYPHTFTVNNKAFPRRDPLFIYISSGTQYSYSGPPVTFRVGVCYNLGHFPWIGRRALLVCPKEPDAAVYARQLAGFFDTTVEDQIVHDFSLRKYLALQKEI